MKLLRFFCLLPLFMNIACAQQSTLAAPAPTTSKAATEPIAKAPFPYVWGTAYHILPETTSEESGYFSIAEGHNGKIYVGTAKYNHDAYLVEFDPQNETQRIVVDTNKVNGLTATGYAVQAKIHTRNFVAPSGKIYVGSQEGYRTIPGDVSIFPGGYVMRFDPATGKTESLGQPFPQNGNTPGKGVIDVVADEARDILYVVTTKDLENKGKSYWFIGDIKTKTYRPMNLEVTNYATTLMDAQGRANVITADSQIATYDPQTQKITLRDIIIDGKKWSHTNGAIPVWQLTPDKKGAYVVYLEGDSKLHYFDFSGDGPVQGRVLATMLEGKDFDHRSSLTVAPDGRVYALYATENTTGFGNFQLHHLTRYDPKLKKAEDLGVLAVKNPKFFDFRPEVQRPGAAPYTFNGFKNLPDGTLVPTTVHQGLIAAKNGDLYALILYPYTLLKIEGATGPTGTRQKVPVVAPAQQYTNFALRAVADVENNQTEIERVAAIIAARHLKGGLVSAVFHQQSLEEEITGRAGGLMAASVGWPGRTPEMDKQNVALVGWERAPGAGDLEQLQKLHDAGTLIVGFGPRAMPQLAEHVKLCDEFFDTGLGANDQVVTLPDGSHVGQGNLLINMLNAWSLTGEFVAALTREGKMPTMWKSWMYPDGRAWSDKYYNKMQFHDDFTIAPIAAGVLSRAYLEEIRANIHRFSDTQSTFVTRAANMIAKESKAGRKTIVATQGHAPWRYVGQNEDARWAILNDFDHEVPSQMEAQAKTPDKALVLRLGYQGLHKDEAALLAKKKQRVILISVPSPLPDFQPPAKLPLSIDMGWKYGDAAVDIAGYPIKILPPSGVMQIVAYESINVEVLARLK
ncbi:MAG: hypothetical protein ABI210_12235 [Abditibacteriaceae bacterium]